MSLEQRTILVGDQRVVYSIRKSSRAKRLIITLDHDGSVEVIIPQRSSYQAGEKFLRQRVSWLEKELVKQQAQASKNFHSCKDGTQIPFLGEELTIVLKHEVRRKRAHVKQDASKLIIKLPSDDSPRQAVERWYRRQARDYFEREAKALGELVGVKIKGVRIGNYRSQWGSANRKGILSFNWRLLLGPSRVAEYLVAHEVAHLIEANHSKRYWQIVKKLMPDYEKPRHWLRRHASQLVW